MKMEWFIFAIICAILYATLHLLCKKTIRKEDPRYVTFSLLFTRAVFLLLVVYFLWDKLIFNLNTIIGLVIIGLIIAVADILYFKSIKNGSISRTIPLLSITPLFTLPLAFVLVGELPGLLGIGGICLLVLGIYILNLEKLTREHLFDPLKSIFKHKSSKYMLIVAAVFGLASSMDKFIIINSNVLTRLFMGVYFALFFVTVYLLLTDKKHFIKKVKITFNDRYLLIFLIAIIAFFTLVAQFIAISLTYAAYVIAIKRTSAIFAVIAAHFIFREKKNFGHALTGTIFLVAGAVMLMF
jgi:drug/metabolite transporter (DMT)-like permease